MRARTTVAQGVDRGLALREHLLDVGVPVGIVPPVPMLLRGLNPAGPQLSSAFAVL